MAYSARNVKKIMRRNDYRPPGTIEFCVVAIDVFYKKPETGYMRVPVLEAED